MPEVESVKFSNTELTEILIKAAGIHEGEWVLQVNFGFSAGNFGPDDDSLSPGAIAMINYVGLTKAKPNSPKGLIVDAAAINPSAT